MHAWTPNRIKTFLFIFLNEVSYFTETQLVIKMRQFQRYAGFFRRLSSSSSGNICCLIHHRVAKEEGITIHHQKQELNLWRAFSGDLKTILHRCNPIIRL